MTNAEAEQKAKELYGQNAVVEVYKGYCQICVLHDLNGRWKKEWGPLKNLLGYGKTWEEAFDMAEKRKWAHEKIQSSR